MHHVIVDGNSIAHWRFWATPQLQVGGQEVGMLHSFVSWLHDVERSMQPGKLTVCFDSRRNWRYDILPTYKGQRGERHEALTPQLERMNDYIAERFGPVCYEVEGYEADDLCAELATEDATVISRDKDLRQLVDDSRGVRVFDPVARVIYDEAEVIRKHDVPAYRLRDLLAISGDSADNVPGPPEWGKGTAVKAIGETIDFEHLMETCLALRLSNVSKRKQQLFNDSRALVRRNYELVGLRSPAP